MKVIKILKPITFFACLLISGLAFGQKKVKTYQVDTVTKYVPLADFKTDTLAYLKTNFIVNQSFYLNKNVDYLINHLQLPILKYVAITGGNYVEGNEPQQCVGLDLYFSKNEAYLLTKALQKKGSLPLVLIVFFKKPILYEIVVENLRKIGPPYRGRPPGFLTQQIVEKLAMIDQNDK